MDSGNVRVTGHSCVHTSEGEPTTCPMCVARLEAELAERWTEGEAKEEVAELLEVAALQVAELEQERDEAQAACAAKDAALRRAAYAYHANDHIGYLFDGCPSPICIAAHAALSDAGKGWPEVREQARKALTFCTQESIHRQFHLGYRDDRQENCPACVEARAALDALGR